MAEIGWAAQGQMSQPGCGFLGSQKKGVQSTVPPRIYLQSSCARLLSSDPWLRERTKFTRQMGADTVI